MMLQGTTDHDLSSQLLQAARDPDLRLSIYERLGDYCHQCRNRLNSVKLSLYLAMRHSETSASEVWAEIERRYQELERRVDQIQTLFRPMSLSRVTLGIDLLIEDRREAWTRLMAANGRTLEVVAPADRAVASFDVERMGQALDLLVDLRASNRGPATSARLRWWADAGYAHIAWEEFNPGLTREPGSPQDEGSRWALPLLARVAQAHEGDFRVKDDRDWKLEVTWPASPDSASLSESPHAHLHTRDRGEFGP